MPRPTPVETLLGRRVRALRSARNLTQEDLGERAGLTGKFIGQIERGTGNPSLKALAAISQALEVELWELVRFEEAQPRGAPVETAARAFVAAERMSDYLSGRPAADVERALRILEAALGESPPGGRSSGR